MKRAGTMLLAALICASCAGADTTVDADAVGEDRIPLQVVAIDGRKYEVDGAGYDRETVETFKGEAVKVWVHETSIGVRAVAEPPLTKSDLATARKVAREVCISQGLVVNARESGAYEVDGLWTLFNLCEWP